MYRILYVDDENYLLDLSKSILEAKGEFVVDTLTSASEALKQHNLQQYDAIISDYQMPEMDGIAFLRAVRERFHTIPFILFTGRGREEIVIEAINNGADYYIQKGGEPKAQYAELIHHLKKAIERRQDQDAIKDSEQRLTDIINFLPDATFAIDRSGRVMVWNRAIEEMTGIPAADMVGKNDYAYAIPFYGERRPMLIDLIDEPDEIISHHYTHIIRDRDLLIAETTLSCPKGKLGILTGTASPLFNCQGESIGAIEAIRDITELKKSEAELQASEEKYRMVVENSHDAIYIYRGSDLLFVNKVASELTGYTHDELLNKNVWDLIHPEDRDRLRESGSRRMGGETLSSIFSARILTKAGDIRIGKFFVDIVSYLGQPAILGILRDVTDQVRAEEELNAANEQLVASSEELKSQFNELAESEQRIRESEVKYRILLDESTDPIFSFFPDGTYRYVNRAFAEGVGKTADEITGKKIWDVFDRDEAEKRFSVLRTVFSSGEGKGFEVRVPRPDGDRYYVTTVIPVKDEAGSVVSAICSSKEITARKSAEEALRQANRKLNLLSGITRHDIINQLSALDGFVELLQRKTSDPALEHYFSKITEASDRISAMIRFSEEYEKIGVLAPAWQDCRTIVDAQVQKAPLGRVRIINDLPPGFTIFADPLIERVIYNLMDNAARYGGKISTVRFFSLERDGNRVIICEDDGIGIPNENKDQIFNVGFGENTGLGLSLSREILDITGITIHENGQPGSGARFEITVPKGAYRFSDCSNQ